ncbi:YitT family protein [Bacillus kwashiorkori]|uniref:YitT family protein n=1 Tax=Bacillus kwashiorkori TaxID=1522318 RepID=UPI000785BC96|nr:YitT family protein [Bacillus kwashiorkori]
MLSLELRKALVVTIGAFIYSVGVNFFMIPANVYAGGFSGISQLLSRVLYEYLGLRISMGTFLLLLNIPVTILAWKKIGKSFTLYSFLSVVLTSVFLHFVPIYPLSDDILLNAVFGGLITGTGVGFTLKWGASTGGMDIIAAILSKIKDEPFGKYTLMLNGVIVALAGILFGWEKALYTLVTLYTTSRIIDMIHTRSQKLTAMIITKRTKLMKAEIIKRLGRGITIVPARGAFTDDYREMLITVITRYELFELKRIIHEIDPEAFTNIIHTEGIYGRFRRDD